MSNKYKPNTWLDTEAWPNVTWMKRLIHEKESRADSLKESCTLDDDQLGRNMLWYKAEGRNSDT
jgi:hypothetical protein